MVVDGVSEAEGLSRAATLSASLLFQLMEIMLTVYYPPTERIPLRINGSSSRQMALRLGSPVAPRGEGHKQSGVNVISNSRKRGLT